MPEELKPRRNGLVPVWAAITVALTAAALVGGGIKWVSVIANELGRQSEKVTQVESRAEEDREIQRRAFEEIKRDVKSIAADVTAILRKLDAIEAVRDAEKSRRTK